MSTVVISPEEYELLEKRGFFIRDNNSFLSFLKSMIAISMLAYSIGGIGYLLAASSHEFITNINVSYCILGILLGLYIVPSYYFIISSKTYYTKDGIVGFGTKTKEDIVSSKIDEISFMWNFLSEVIEKINSIGEKGTNEINQILTFFFFGGLSLIGSFGLFGYFGNYLLSMDLGYIILSAGMALGITWIFSYIIYNINKLINTFHPLYAFGNIGEKIQNLTPQIEEQSKKIQSEFQSDMNFSVLSDGFDSLSATFSEIITLVIKLERAEARANKGNLFDSEKYINSLRSDIVDPLRSLREFLKIQKNTLLESQKELIQVRVGGKDPEINSGGLEHIELQSKRSESLIVELTENIEKLDMMIGKIG